MNRKTEITVSLTEQDAALYRQTGAGAYLRENSVRLAEMALSHDALARLIQQTAPELSSEISRYDGASADPLLRELFPASDLAINGWRVEVRLLTPAEDGFRVDSTFAQAPAHPQAYVALELRSGEQEQIARFRGWATWEEVVALPVENGDAPPAYGVRNSDLHAEWERLLAHLSREGAPRLELAPVGPCYASDDRAELAATFQQLLQHPDAVDRERYLHCLACERCQDRAVHLLRYQSDATLSVEVGERLLAEHRGEAALQQFERALRLSPRYEQALLGRVNALWQLGRYGDALAKATEALKLRVDPLVFRRAQAALHHLLGHASAALADLSLAITTRSTQVGSLFGSLVAFPQPAPAWAYVPKARAGTRAEVVVLDIEDPGRELTPRVQGPELRPAEAGSVLALYVDGLPGELAERRYRVLVLSRGLHTEIERHTGPGWPALAAAMAGPLDPQWNLALQDLALLRDREGRPVEGRVAEGGVVDMWQSLPALPPEAFEAKTIVLFLFDQQRASA
jgi:tetratricopeptide (TPR) repeat protein